MTYLVFSMKFISHCFNRTASLRLGGNASLGLNIDWLLVVVIFIVILNKGAQLSTCSGIEEVADTRSIRANVGGSIVLSTG